MPLRKQQKYETGRSAGSATLTLIVQRYYSLCATVHFGKTKDSLQILHHRHVSLYVTACVGVCLDAVYRGEAWFGEALADMQEHDT